MKFYHALFPTFCVSMSLFVSGCNKGSQTQSNVNQAVAVKVIQVGQNQQGQAIGYSGTVEEDNATLLSFSTAGTVTALNFNDGQRVNKGQYLGSVDATQAENALSSARAVLMQAEDAYNRVKQMYEKKSVPEIKFVEMQSKLQQAQSGVEMAKKAVSDCRLYAPQSGVVADKQVQVGQNVMPGAPVAKIVNVGKLKIKISVPENEVAAIKIGAKATVRVDAIDREFKAQVSEKGVVADALSRSYEIKLCPQSSITELLPGMLCSVELDEAKADGRKLCVPIKVVQLDENNEQFLWLNVEGKAQRRTIKTGAFVGNDVEVISGLSSSDQIIVEGQSKVCQGTPLAPTLVTNTL